MSRFLNIFYRFFWRFRIGEVQPTEILTRFLANSGYFAKSKGRVKQSGFIPANNELSVFRTSDYDEFRVWNLAEKYVDDGMRGRLMKARADLFAQIVYDQGLQVISDGRPHRAHANIIDWPQEKHARKDIAIELANASALFVRPTREI